MKCVERSHRDGEGCHRARQDGILQLHQGDVTQQGPHMLAMRSIALIGVDAVPDLDLEQSARNQRLLPEFRGGRSVFGEKLGQENGAIEVDHRSSRSRSMSFINFSNVMTGLRGGSGPDGSAGGRSTPLRTRSASFALVRPESRAWGGTSSATTLSRSVTRIVSPLAARRTYSLSLFFRILRPTTRMFRKVAPRSYLRQAER